MRRPQDGAIPVAHEQVLRVLQAVAARLGAEALLALLELLQQAEVAGDLCAHLAGSMARLRWGGVVGCLAGGAAAGVEAGREAVERVWLEGE